MNWTVYFCIDVIISVNFRKYKNITAWKTFCVGTFEECIQEKGVCLCASSNDVYHMQ